MNEKIKFENLKEPPDNEKMKKIWDTLKEFQQETRKFETAMQEVEIQIKDNKPIGIAFIADIHVGAITTDHEALERALNLIKSVDGLYIISCGDTVDNYLPNFHASGSFEAIIPPELQKRFVEWLYTKIAGKLIAIIQGCHDEASHMTDDFDWTKYLSEKFRCHNLGFGGFINLTLGEQIYRIGAWHRIRRFNSYKNITHVVKRAIEIYGDFDVGVVAHNHVAAIEIEDTPAKTRIYIRPGSFKEADRWARQMGYASTPARVPVVILYPNEKRMVPFQDFEEAIRYLCFLRGQPAPTIEDPKSDENGKERIAIDNYRVERADGTWISVDALSGYRYHYDKNNRLTRRERFKDNREVFEFDGKIILDMSEFLRDGDYVEIEKQDDDTFVVRKMWNEKELDDFLKRMKKKRGKKDGGK
jgi:hypothetical protein